MSPSSLEIKWAHARAIEMEIRVELKKKDNLPSYDHVDLLITEARKASLDVIFADFEYATEQNVEGLLWEVTVLIKNRYKRLLDRLADKADARVEKRKLEKRYVDYLKTTQYFYKSYIQRLASHFGGMKDLRRIAHRLQLETLSVDTPVKVAPAVERLIDTSCHSTLLRLGDLSRYRNEIRTKKPSSVWDVALGYYGLARDLCPDSGSSHNQMAVIALADQNHLDALYHLYRAIAVNHPHQLARGNLEIEFKKISSIWDKKEKQAIPHAKTESESALVLWFVRLHAKFYKGEEWTSHNELENEVLSRLALLLKEQSFEITLERIVIINIAAQYVAAERVKENGKEVTLEITKSFYFLLRFNLRVLFILLQILHPELESTATGDDLPSESRSTKRETITAVARRILPALRQYSIWLVSQASIITAPVGDGTLKLHAKQMWNLYADVMTQIVAVFPAENLPTVKYLLEEDETTVGFKPLRNPPNIADNNNNFYTTATGQLKPRLTDPGIERNHPNVEMLARVRDIVLSALTLHITDGSPIKLINTKIGTSQFVFVENDVLLASPPPVQAQHTKLQDMTNLTDAASSTTVHSCMSSDFINSLSHKSSFSWNQTSDSHENTDPDMNRMVDDLLETSTSSGSHSVDDETSYGMHSTTANEVFAPSTFGYQNLQRINPCHDTSSINPGIWSTPFTPKPNELPPISPERPSTARQLPPSYINTNIESRGLQDAASGAAEKHAAYEAARSSWDKAISRPPASTPFSLSPVPGIQAPQALLDDLARQFALEHGQSSNFSEDSNIYANPPLSDVRVGNFNSRRGPAGLSIGNNTTVYPGASDFGTFSMLQSSIWNGSQPARGHYNKTPPGGQGG